MHIGEISFCDKIGYNIKSDDVKKKLLEDLESKYHFRVIQKHHDRYNPDVHQHVLHKNPHLITLRTNGNPYMLYLTKCNFNNQCIFIDKKIQQGYFYPRMIIAKLWFDDALFNDTLIDGEMVKTSNGEWHFVIHDILAYSSQNLWEQNLVKRINMAYNILKTQYFEDELSCCKLKIKKYMTYSNVHEVLPKLLSELPYTCRGLYFKPLFIKFKDILVNFDDTLIRKVVKIKYKDISATTFLLANKESNQPTHNNLVDTNIQDTYSGQHIHEEITAQESNNQSNIIDEAALAVYYLKKTNQPDIYEMYDQKDAVKYLHIALVNSIKTSKQLRNEFASANLTDRIPYRCKYNSRFSKWVPLERL